MLYPNIDLEFFQTYLFSLEKTQTEKKVLLTRRTSLGTIRVFPGSIRPTTDFSYDDTGSR